MRYLIEGTDRSGKDTLAKMLAESLGSLVIKDEGHWQFAVHAGMNPAEMNAFLTGVSRAYAETLASVENSIKVRLHVSNLVYNSSRYVVTGNPLDVSRERDSFFSIQALIEKIPDLVIVLLLTPTYEQYLSRITDLDPVISRVDWEYQTALFRMAASWIDMRGVHKVRHFTNFEDAYYVLTNEKKNNERNSERGPFGPDVPTVRGCI